jgi:DNA-binding response OmpR family regulator
LKELPLHLRGLFGIFFTTNYVYSFSNRLNISFMPSIFILDNDAGLMEIMELWLTKEGYEVHTFTTSNKLFHAINIKTPDVILLEIILSDENGKSVCRELKHRFHYPNKIFLFSASPVSIDELQDCEADGFIDKPFDLQEALNILNKAVRT